MPFFDNLLSDSVLVFLMLDIRIEFQNHLSYLVFLIAGVMHGSKTLRLYQGALDHYELRDLAIIYQIMFFQFNF